MKISPIAKKALLSFYFGILIPAIITIFLLAYFRGIPPTFEHLTLTQYMLVSCSPLIAIVSIFFIMLYYGLKSGFKEFEAKFSNLETIIKAIEHSKIEDVTNKKNYQHITYDSGIDVGYDCQGTYWLEEVEIPTFSYLHYLICKKGQEHNQRIKDEESEKRTENIINKMTNSWRD